MSALKPMAGLTSGLLARKGAARPAMRSQLFASLRTQQEGPAAQPNLEDLGWNDMGDDACGQLSDSPVPAVEADAIGSPVSQVQEYIAKRIQFSPGASLLDDTPLEPESDELVTTVAEIHAGRASSSLLAVSPKAVRETRRAVTVRITEERYSQLRDACHVLGCTAQRALSEALEQWLANQGSPAADLTNRW